MSELNTENDVVEIEVADIAEAVAEGVELEATVETETVDKPKRHRAKSLSDSEFITRCNAVAMGENASIKAMMEATGFAESTVQARRSEINGKFKDKAPVLIPLPTGGGAKEKKPELTTDEATEAQAAVAAFLAAREAAKVEPKTETETVTA